MRNIFAFVIVSLLVSLKSLSQTNCNLGLVATPVNPSCTNACNGSVILTPSGGTAPYSLNAFDHSFPGNSVDAGIFDVRNGNFSVTNNQLQATSNIALRNNYDNSVVTKQVFPDNGKIVVEGSFFVEYNSYVNFGLASNTVVTTQNHFPFAFFFNYGRIYLINEGNWTDVGPYSASTWYDIKIEKLGNTVNYYLRNTGLSVYSLAGTKVSQATAPGYKMGASYLNYYNYYGGFTTKNWRVGGNPPTEGLCPGTYNYTVYDVNGCFANASVTLGVDPGPTGLQLIGTVEPASCNTASNGSVALVPTGGNAPYTFDFAHVFAGGVINTNIFELRNGNFSQTTDLRQGINYNNNNSWDNSISTRQTFSDGGFLQLDASFKFDANAEVIFGFTNTGVIDDYQDVFFGFRIANGTSLSAYTKSGGLISLGAISADTWYDFRIERTGHGVKFYTSVHGSGIYTLRHTATFNTTNIEYKAAALNFANFYSSSGGYNTKGWNVQVTPKTDHLAPGTYTYTITDANGCTATSVFNVGTGGGNGVTLAANLVNGTIANTATGAVSLTPAGGSTPYKYSLQPDFSAATIDAISFSTRNGSFSQPNGSLRAATGTLPTYDNSVYTKASFTDAGKLSLEGSFSFDNNANVYFGFTNNADLTDASQMQMAFFVSGNQLLARVGANSTVIGSINPSTWYDLKIEKTNSLVRFFIRITGQPSYNQLFFAPYTGPVTEFKAGFAMYGPSGGFNTNNWTIDCNPPLTGLAQGQYSYRVYDAFGCYSMAGIQVPVSSTITLTGQGTNTSAWNVSDGSVSLNSSPANNFSIYSNVFNENFAGSVLNTNSFSIRNGAFSQNNGLNAGTLFNNSGWDNSIVSTQAFANNGTIAVDMEMSFQNGTDVYFGFAPDNQTVTSYSALPFAFHYESGKLYAYSQEAGNVLLGTVSANAWHSFRIERTGSAVKFYLKHAPDALYQQVYSMNTTAPVGNYKVGAVNFFSTQTGFNRGYSSKNWEVYNNATYNGLAVGSYGYAVMSNANTLAETNVVVGTDFALIQSMTAPADVVVNTDLNDDVATNVALGNPTFGATPVGVVITNNAPVAFPVGNTTVTWTATQGSLTVTGTQLVTVVDNQAPNVFAPADVIVNLFGGQTIATNVALGIATATDNVTPIVAITNNAPSQYAVGTTVVTWYGSDAAGNVGFTTQLVTVNSVSIPPVTAPADVTVNNDPGQSYTSQQNVNLGTPDIGVIIPGMTVTNNAPAQFPIGTTAVTWTIVVGTETVSLIQYVTVVDNENPLLSIPANVSVSTDATTNVATNVALGNAVASDNSGSVTVTNNAPTTFPLGNTIVTWTATDAAGNTVSQTQVVTVADLIAPSITAPANITINTDAGKAFATIVSIGTATASDNVAIASVTNNNIIALEYPVGTTVITWTATDAAGNTATATQTIIVIDNQSPVVNVPADIYLNTDAGAAYATLVSLVPPTASDNVAVVSITNTGVPANMQFPIGTTIITWIVKDAAGNTTTITQKIIVTDNQPPSIVAPADITVYADGGASYATLNAIGNATVSDNSGSVVVTSNKPANGQYAFGNTIVTWTATDASGNTATATQTITVLDNELPSITAPANIVVNTGAGIAYATLASLGSPVVSDNVAIASVTNNAAANMQFATGTTTITWAVTDVAGNTATATQTVTVVDAENPTIIAPADINITIGASQTTVTGVQLGLPTVADNVGVTSVTNNAPSIYNIGTTVITWTVTDAAGNSATANQTVTVTVVSLPPIAKCKPITVTLVNGTITINPSQINDGSSAAAGIASLALDKTSFDCSNIGDNNVVLTVTDNNGLSSTCTTTVKVIGQITPVTITSIPTDNTFTGGVSTNLYLGYGAQSTKLQVSLPSTGAPYTYSWTGTGLSNYTSANPVFTATAAGNYVFVVTVTNKYGCKTSEAITICVKDIRATNKNGTKNNKKVIVCHLPPGNPSNVQMIEVGISAVAAHLAHGCSLGTCNQACGTEAKAPITTTEESFDVKVSPNPTSNYFVVQVLSSDKSSKVALRVMDAFGRTVLRESISEGSVFKFGQNFANGSYYLEVVQGEDKKVVKLLKM